MDILLKCSWNFSLAVGHVFNDANERTSFACLDVCLVLNGIELEYDNKEVGDLIIRAAQSIVDEEELGDWLRVQANRFYP